MANVKDHQDPSARPASRTWIDDIGRALHTAQSGAEIDAVERRLDAVQAELRAKWTAPLTGSTHREEVSAGETLRPGLAP